MRERNNLPILVRLNLPESPLALIKSAAAAYQRQNPAIVYTEGVGETLWEFFKTTMFWQGDVLLTPVLVFDQFEEIFTLQTTEHRATLARELGDLFRGTLPHSIRQQRQTARSEGESDITGDLSEQAPNVRVILCLREDYLGALQELAADIPTIFDDRIRLSPLTEQQAQRAICIPASLAQNAATNGQFKSPPFDYTDDALTEIIDFLSGKSEVIEPFQLQLICRHIEEQQIKNGLTTITSHELGGRKRLATIVSDFYKQTIAKLPKTERKHARRLCEEGLLTAEGFRLTLQEKQILSDYRISQASLEALEEARLLRKEPRLESYFYELSHDSLAQPILDNRLFKLPRKQRERYVLSAGLGLVFTLLLGSFAYFQVQAKRQALAAQEDAQQALDAVQKTSDAAEKVLNYLAFDLRDKLAPIGRLDIAEDIQKQVDQYCETVGVYGQSASALNLQSAAHQNTGNSLLAQRQPEKARKTYQQALDLAQKASELEPDKLYLQRNLSVSLVNLGDALNALGKQPEAQQNYQASLAIRQKLVALDPSDAEWQHDLSSVLSRLKRFNEAAEVAQHAATRLINKPDSPTKNQNLAGAYLNLAWYELLNQQLRNAIVASEKGLKLDINESMNVMLTTNLAHGYLFSGRFQKAKRLYLDNKDKKVTDGRSFKQVVLDDFKEFQKHGLHHPDIKRIESVLH